MYRNLAACCALILSVGALNAQISLPAQAGELHGYVSAALSTAGGPEQIALPGVRVFLRRENGEAEVPSSSVVTDARGHFQIPNQPAGKYRVCADNPSFVPGCAAEDIEISDYPVYLKSDLLLNPSGSALFGRVTLKDGSPAARSAPGFPQSPGAAEVTIVDNADETVAGPARVNIFGYYVLANIAQRSDLKVRVQYEAATATSRLSPALGRLDLEVPDTPPVIESLVASVNGKPVTQVRPGTVVDIRLNAKDAERDRLHYKWEASSGPFTSRDSPSIRWKLPASAATNRLFVEVSDGKGGVARTFITVLTSTSSVPAAVRIAPSNTHLLLSSLKQPKATPPPSHLGSFVDAQEPMDCISNEARCRVEATNYYKEIRALDQNGNPTALGTFSAWKKTFGFSQDPLKKVPDEVRTVYFNNGDLQLGRDMHCRQIPNPPGKPIQIACYVTNFINTVRPGDNPNPQLSILLASQNVNPFATVAMTFTADATPSVKFFVFDQTGALSTDAILDSQSRKAVPGVCVACHGGKYDSNAHLSNRSNFLPFDTSSFIFDGDGDFSEPNQRESFRKLNSMVKSTAPVQTIRDLIDGWYSCGVDKPGCAPDPEFVPGGDDCPASSSPIFPTCGWSQASVPHYNFDPKKFYLAVPKTYCRTCHVARPESFNVQNFTDFKLGVSSVAASVCKGFRMPDAEVPYNGFWANSSAQQALSGLLAAITSNPVSCER